MASFKVSPLVLNLFRPFEIPCNIFGVTVTSISKRNLTIWLNFVYTLFHMIFSSCLILYRIENIEPQFCQANAISQSVNAIQQILGFSVILSIYYQTLFRKKDVNKVLKLISKSDQQLQKLNQISQQKAFGIKILIEAIVVVLYAYGTYILFSIHYKVTSYKLLIIEYFSAINPILLMYLVLLMFINFCWHLKKKFNHLKIVMQNLVMSNKRPHNTDEIWAIKAQNESTPILFNQIQMIAKTYETLFDTVNLLNRIFGMSNLASIGECANKGF